MTDGPGPQPPERPGGSLRTPQPLRVGGGWPLLYAILAAGFFGAGGYMTLVRGAAWTDPAVVVSMVGGLWFVARTVMTLRRKP